MATISHVVSSDTFLAWRTRTNDLIDILNMPTVGVVNQLSTRVDTFNITDSAGVHIGCTISDNADGTVAVAAGEAILRTANSPTASMVSVEVSAIASVALTDLTTNFIYVDYNAGTPTISVTTLDTNVNGRNMAMVGYVQRDGLNLTILQLAGNVGDFENTLTKRLQLADGFKKSAGAILSEPTPLHLALTAGEFYYGVTKLPTPAFDTSGASTFEYYSNSGTWNKSVVSALSNTQYNNSSVGLVALTAGYYRVDWIYLKIGTNGVIPYVVMGTQEHSSQVAAQSETPPQNIPPQLKYLGVLVGRAIIMQGNPNIVVLDNALNSQNFAASVGVTSFSDDTFSVVDNIDATKKANFQAGNITPATTRTLTIPDKNGTLLVDSEFAGVYAGRLTRTAAGYAAIKDVLNATVKPSATDDSTAGFEVGSLWVDVIANAFYICVDATATAAVWKSSGIAAALNTSGSYTYTAGKATASNIVDVNGNNIAYAYTYDAAGNINTVAQTIAGVTRTTTYTYNADGTVASFVTV